MSAYFGDSPLILTRKHREAVWASILLAWQRSTKTPEVRAALADVVQQLEDQRLWPYAPAPTEVFLERTAAQTVWPHG